jgi:hypothetical protein
MTISPRHCCASARNGMSRRVGAGLAQSAAASVLAAAVLLVVGSHAHAESCARSRDAVLNGADLPQPPQAYRDLFKMCMAAISMPNVKDAFLLVDGGIAVIPKRDTVAATAATLSEFCQAYPRATMRFLSRKDLQRVANSMELLVRLSSTGATTCKKIRGDELKD